MKPFIERFAVGCYRQPIVLAIAGDEPTVSKYLERHFGCDDRCWGDKRARFDLTNGGAAGRTLMLACGVMVVLLRSARLAADDIETISHEAFHATKNTLDRCGVPATDDTEEAWAYALASIVGQIYRLTLKARRRT